MYGLLLSLVLGFAAGAVLRFVCGFSTVWSITDGVAVFAAAQAVSALILRGKFKKLNQDLQNVMQEIQTKIQRRQQYFMMHPSGNQKVMMAQLEHEQALGLEKALEVLKNYDHLARWNILIGKQLNTMKMAFLFQLKRYDEADALIPKCLFFDAQSIAMRLARLASAGDAEGLKKFYYRKIRALKGDNVVLPTAVFTWAMVKQGNTEEAVKALVLAKGKTENEVLLRNWKALVNNKPKQFSNAGLAEMWYAMGLEEMKVPRMQMRYPHR